MVEEEGGEGAEGPEGQEGGASTPLYLRRMWEERVAIRRRGRMPLLQMRMIVVRVTTLRQPQDGEQGGFLRPAVPPLCFAVTTTIPTTT